jgi:predicted SPOUT superfamily RNA methylase MTH1
VCAANPRWAWLFANYSPSSMTRVCTSFRRSVSFCFDVSWIFRIFRIDFIIIFSSSKSSSFLAQYLVTNIHTYTNASEMLQYLWHELRELSIEDVILDYR